LLLNLERFPGILRAERARFLLKGPERKKTMATRRSCQWTLMGLGLALAVAAVGCSNDDPDHLARVAKCVAAKGEGLTGDADKTLTGLQALQTNMDELTLDARVSARLRWDKDLAGAQIQVQARDGALEMTGTVRDLSQRRRAVDLAQSTVGTEKVVDRLEISAP
jgi:osmotically-inducible protein OsmY